MGEGGEGLLSFSMIITSKLVGFDLIIISLFFLIFCNSPIFPFFDSSLNVGLQKTEKFWTYVKSVPTIPYKLINSLNKGRHY